MYIKASLKHQPALVNYRPILNPQGTDCSKRIGELEMNSAVNKHSFISSYADQILSAVLSNNISAAHNQTSVLSCACLSQMDFIAALLPTLCWPVAVVC